MLHTNKSKSNPASTSSAMTVSGVLQICGGICLAAIFGIIGMVRLLHSVLLGGTMGIGGIVVLTVFLVGGVLLVWRGVGNLRLAGQFRKVTKTMGKADRQKLEVLSAALGCSQDKAANLLRSMLARGLWEAGYFDLEAREFVLGDPDPQEPAGETILREVKVRSIVPLVLLGTVWVVYGIFLQGQVSAIVVALVSVIVFLAARMAIPAKTKVIEDRVSRPASVKVDTGDKEADEVLAAANSQIEQMVAYNKKISHQRINSQVNRLVEISREILAYLAKNVDKLRSVRQFLNYYLPTTVKLLESYDELSRQTVKGENITDTMRKIESMLDNLVKAFEKELDGLFRDQAVDISADIAVMQGMIRREGLTDDFFGSSQT